MSRAQPAEVEETVPPRPIAPAWASFTVLALAAIALAALWSQLPARWPSHYGLDGTPDQWTDKSVFGAFWPLGLGVLLCGAFELLARFLPALSRGRSAPGLSESGRLAIAAATGDLLRIVGIAIAILLSLVAIALPLLQPQSPKLVIGAAFLVIGAAIFFACDASRACSARSWTPPAALSRAGTASSTATQTTRACGCRRSWAPATRSTSGGGSRG